MPAFFWWVLVGALAADRRGVALHDGGPSLLKTPDHPQAPRCLPNDDRLRHLRALQQRASSAAAMRLALHAALVGIIACGPDNVTVGHVVPSPDSALVARYYQLYWAPPGTHSAERVSVLPRDASFHPRTSDFIFEMSGGGDLTLTWTGPRHLVIAHPGWADIRRRCGAAGGATFSYVPRTEPDSSWTKLARVYHANHRQLDAYETSQGRPLVPRVDHGLTANCS